MARPTQAELRRQLVETSDKATHQEDVDASLARSALGAFMLDEITLDVIDGVKAEKLKTAGQSTVNRYLSLIRAILRRARDDWEWTDKTPKVKMFKEPPGRERSITVEQAETLLGELPAHQHDVVLFVLASGLRQSNVIGLEWSHVDLDAGHAWVSAGQSKNRRPIAVPLNGTALEGLATTARQTSVRVFTYAGKALGSANTLAWRKALKRAGIENFRWHDLRHTWASWDRQSGTPTHELQRLRRLALFGDGRTLRTFGARPSRESSQPARFAARWLRFGYAGEGKGIGRRALIPCNNWCRQ